MCGLICGRKAINTKADAIEMFMVGKSRGDRTVIGEAPEKATILLVPHDVYQVISPVAHIREILFAQGRLAEDYLRGNPCHAPLKHGKLSLALKRAPIAREIGMEATVDI